MPLTVALSAPANGTHFGTGSTIPVTLALTGSPTNVSFYLDGALATNRTAAPFTPVALPAQSTGSHTIYATAQDQSSGLLRTVTNTFQVDASLSGTLSGNTTLYASNSPCLITGNLTVPNGVTLTIEAGTTVYISPGVTITVANGGRIEAEGTESARIHIMAVPSSANWGGIIINGAGASPETRMAYIDFQGNNGTPGGEGNACIEVSGGTFYLDHATFLNTNVQYLSLDGASFLLSACHFPSANTSSPFELVHGTGGIKSGGRGIVRECFFGSDTGYNDLMDFTGGNREQGQPIVQYYNNVFLGSGDDELDLDGTDAWIEGNIFLHAHKNGSPDSSSGVSGGNTGSDTSQITIIGNIFYDCDQAAMAKEGNFFTLMNNTIVHQTSVGSQDAGLTAVVCLEDGGVPEGAGMYLEGNIIYDAEKLTRGVTNSIVTFTNNIICQLQGTPWSGRGGSNTTNNPMLNYVPQVSETYFTNWAQAQVMWQWFGLRTNSPAIGTGPNGRDKGGVIPYGASISGEPAGTTTNISATLTVGVNRTGNGIPATGWPNGSGFTFYQWRLDTNAWSADIPLATPIVLSNLAIGSHHVEVIGKNDAGYYQNDPALGADALVTMSRTWNVESNLRITSITRNSTSITLHIPAVAGATYTVLYKNSITAPSWSKLTDIPSQFSPGDYPVSDSLAPDQTRFYRIVTPAQP